MLKLLSLLNNNTGFINIEISHDTGELAVESISRWRGNHDKRTVLDTLRETGDDVALNSIMREGFLGIKCVESGGPEPGVGLRGAGTRYQKSVTLYQESRSRRTLCQGTAFLRMGSTPILRDPRGRRSSYQYRPFF